MAPKQRYGIRLPRKLGRWQSRPYAPTDRNFCQGDANLSDLLPRNAFPPVGDSQVGGAGATQVGHTASTLSG